MYIQAQASQTQAYTVYTKPNIPLDILVLQAQKNTDVHIYVTVGLKLIALLNIGSIYFK